MFHHRDQPVLPNGRRDDLELWGVISRLQAKLSGAEWVLAMLAYQLRHYRHMWHV
jgi:hypothetical protein